MLISCLVVYPLTFSRSRWARMAMSLPASTAFLMHLASTEVKRSMLALLGASQLPQSYLCTQGGKQGGAGLVGMQVDPWRLLLDR